MKSISLRPLEKLEKFLKFQLPIKAQKLIEFISSELATTLFLPFELPERRGPELAFTLQQILARQLGLTPAEAAVLVKGSPCLRLPVDPDCGALLVRDLQHQAIRARLQPVDAAPP